MSDSLRPYRLLPVRLLCLWDFPGKNTWMGSLQVIFLNQGSKPGLLHCRQILYNLSHQRSPLLLLAYIFKICIPRWWIDTFVIKINIFKNCFSVMLVGSWKKQESSRKIFISALLTISKPLTVWISINCGQFWKRWEYQSTWPASWETYMQVRKQQLQLDMEQQTCSKQVKEYVKAVYCDPAYITFMQNT